MRQNDSLQLAKKNQCSRSNSCSISTKYQLNLNVVTTSEDVKSTLKQRQISTLNQRQNFNVHSTFIFNQNSTSFQRWGMTLFQRWINVEMPAGYVYIFVQWPPLFCKKKIRIYVSTISLLFWVIFYSNEIDIVITRCYPYHIKIQHSKTRTNKINIVIYIDKFAFERKRL